MSNDDLDMLATEIPSCTAESVLESLTQSGVVASNSEARRMIEGGAISVNGKKISEDQTVEKPSIIKGKTPSF